jgi:hypothetical protein
MSQACLLICILADIQGEIIETLDENKSVNKCADEPSSMLVDNCRGKMYDGCGQNAILKNMLWTNSRLGYKMQGVNADESSDSTPAPPPAYGIRQHTSAYAQQRQHTSAYAQQEMTHTNSRPVTGKMPQNVTERPTFGINSVVTHST